MTPIKLIGEFAKGFAIVAACLVGVIAGVAGLGLVARAMVRFGLQIYGHLGGAIAVASFFVLLLSLLGGLASVGVARRDAKFAVRKVKP